MMCAFCSGIPDAAYQAERLKSFRGLYHIKFAKVRQKYLRNRDRCIILKKTLYRNEGLLWNRQNLPGKQCFSPDLLL